MTFCLRHNIHKGEGFIVLENLMIRNITVKHFGKDVVIVVFGLVVLTHFHSLIGY